MGLPGSGKSYLAERLVSLLDAAWINGDRIRTMLNNWDFTEKGRLIQSHRMRNIADFESNLDRLVICDFVCPTEETRKNFDADIVIWMDTIKQGRFEDTNQMFQKPKKVDFHITELNDHNHFDIAKEIAHQNLHGTSCD